MAQEQSLFSEVVSLQPKSDGEILFPAVLHPNPKVPKLVQLTEAIKANKEWIDSLLYQTGAILFRGFPVFTASDFSDVVESSGYDDFPYEEAGTGSRTKISGRVYTANESPPEQKIGFHHELSYANEFPLKLFFFCKVEPGSGGETCIVQSHVIYDKMKQKHPKFVADLEEKGLTYMRVLGKESDLSSPAGRGWMDIFKTDDKSVAEERANKTGNKLEWMGENVKLIIGPKPGFRYDEGRQRKIWFNNVAILYGGTTDKLNNDPTKEVVFGDGEVLPSYEVNELLKMLDDECVALQWQKGDVLLLDNLAVLHSRWPLLAPPRRILASLCK
ncbi:clavaminate synthase-like protein At3g21360 [Rutidosis leptorrhynchoides]|uniref:clavaminate synthase-like protein At3g21360 n=1 Tax=Rutidosis leptorrhynchoides TaxID=125765 RepID=UPI003A99F313